MPKFIKILIGLSALIMLLVLGLHMTGNEHLIEAARSTYARGRTGPDIDNYKYFDSHLVEKGKRQKWPELAEKIPLTKADSIAIERFETVSFAVFHKGKIISETYWEGYDEERFSNSFSMAKSIVALLVGCAIDDGKINSIEDPIGAYLPELKGTDREFITIKQLLQMTSGIGFDESYGDPFGFMAKAYYGDELIEKTMSFPLSKEPGSTWEYLGGNTLLLSFIVQRTTGVALSDYASKKLWRPLGAEHPALWSIDSSTETERAYCCFYSNARDFARLGQLMLCDGNWQGEQLISAKYIEEMTSPVILNDGNQVPFYGYQYWLDNIQGHDIEYMRGILGQYVISIPSKELVIVRLGHTRSSEFIGNSPADVNDYVGIALAMLN